MRRSDSYGERRRVPGGVFNTLSVILLLLVASGCGSGPSSKQASAEGASADSTDASPKKKRERTTSVGCARVVRGDLVIPVVAEGTVRARHSAEIRAELEGKIVEIPAQEGQLVGEGEVIALLDDREYQVAVEEARANYLRALSTLAVEEDSVVVKELSPLLRDRMAELERMEKSGEISREDRMAREVALDMEALRRGYYRVDIAAARSGVAAARSSLERALLDLERTRIRAPFSGVVSGLTLSEGEQVSKGQIICTLVNKVDLEADVGVLEADMGKIKEGRPVLLVFPSLDDTMRASVDVISPQFDTETRTCQILVRFSSRQGRVRPGMFVRAIVAGETLPERLLVPNEAILTRDGRPLLFKVEENRSKWLYVRTGRRNDQVVEIEKVLQGGSLSPGDSVIVSNHLTLSHDSKVRVKKILPTKDPWRARRGIE